MPVTALKTQVVVIQCWVTGKPIDSTIANPTATAKINSSFISVSFLDPGEENLYAFFNFRAFIQNIKKTMSCFQLIDSGSRLAVRNAQGISRFKIKLPGVASFFRTDFKSVDSSATAFILVLIILRPWKCRDAKQTNKRLGFVIHTSSIENKKDTRAKRYPQTCLQGHISTSGRKNPDDVCELMQMK